MEVSLQLQQKQVLSLKQQQSIEILQMNALALSEYAKELAEENPLLEWDEESFLPRQEKLLQKMEWLEESDTANRSLYRVEHEADERDAERFGRKEEQTLREYLLFQINTQNIPEGHKVVLRFLAESTAESGWLEKDAIPMMMKRYPMKQETAARILSEFQGLEPAGVGARNLKECLLIQLKQKDAPETTIEIVENYLEDVAKHQFPGIAKKMNMTAEDVMAAVCEIQSCNPKPGSGFAGEGVVEYIIPDIIVEKGPEGLVVMVNGNVIPHLNISHSYVQMLRKGADEKTEAYIAEKLKQAEWALQCISRRENTLKQVAETIVRRQEAFFAGGEISPLRMADVAEEMGIHISTVSRTVRGKYLQCSRGLFLLNRFFSTAVQSAEGNISAESVKERLKTIMEQEDKKKPFSDRMLTEKLNADGVQISRRTVAKYREAMGIPSASSRKSF